jgi:hypothetical protein
VLFFYTRVLFHGLCVDGRSDLGRVLDLCVGRRGGNRPPRLAGSHSRAHCNANKHC